MVVVLVVLVVVLVVLVVVLSAALLPRMASGERSEAPPAESCSSAYLSLSFALSVISLSTKALLLDW